VALPSSARTRLEKAAADNGFDLDHGTLGPWPHFESSPAPAVLWLTVWGGTTLLAALSHPGVLRSLSSVRLAFTHPLPRGAVGGRSVADFAEMHSLLRRALLLDQTLPDALDDAFATRTANLPRSTEAERLVVESVGQDLRRGGLLDLREGRCATSGLAVPRLVCASHPAPGWTARPTGSASRCTTGCGSRPTWTPPSKWGSSPWTTTGGRLSRPRSTTTLSACWGSTGLGASAGSRRDIGPTSPGTGSECFSWSGPHIGTRNQHAGSPRAATMMQLRSPWSVDQSRPMEVSRSYRP
jgi:hypothetical protein